MNPITIVQGGQWGSEGKGNVAAAMCLRGMEGAVRTGAINAGHTVWYQGVEHKMQQIPVGWVNPNTILYIGPGAYIHEETLRREVDLINKAMPYGPDVRTRLFIDHRAGLHHPGHEAQAREANRHAKIGATGKGCAEAIIAKIKNRGDGGLLFRDTNTANDFNLADVPQMLLASYNRGAKLLLEGTQGSLLDMHLGPYPYTTSRMTTAANWVAEAGLPVTLDYNVVLVLRTYPIRVAGNSGPMPFEIRWTTLAREINEKREKLGWHPLISEFYLEEFDALWREYASNTAPEILPVRVMNAMEENHPGSTNKLKVLFEMTTVTKKLRRIARFDVQAAGETARLEGASSVVLTFLDYEFPEVAGMISHQDVYSPRVSEYLDSLEKSIGVRISGVTTGPLTEHVIL